MITLKYFLNRHHNAFIFYVDLFINMDQLKSGAEKVLLVCWR